MLQVGDCVRLGFAKPSGLLKEGDVGVVVEPSKKSCRKQQQDTDFAQLRWLMMARIVCRSRSVLESDTITTMPVQEDSNHLSCANCFVEYGQTSTQ